MAPPDPVVRTVLGAGQAIVRDMGVSIGAAGAAAMGAAGPRAGGVLRSISEAIRADQVQRERREANEQLARLARAAVLRSYRNRTPRRKIAPYRQGASRVGYGLIEAALSDGGHEGRSTRDRVLVFDEGILDRMTKVGSSGALWRQINYGALPSSGKKPRGYQVKFINGAGFEIRGENQPIPAGALKRPVGLWRGPGGELVPPVRNGDDQFVPSRRWRAYPLVPLRGSRATQFMDAGYKAIAENYGPVYSTMYSKVFSDSAKRARLKAKGVYVPGPRVVQPRFFPVSVR